MSKTYQKIKQGNEKQQYKNTKITKLSKLSKIAINKNMDLQENILTFGNLVQ